MVGNEQAALQYAHYLYTSLKISLFPKQIFLSFGIINDRDKRQESVCVKSCAGV